MSTISHPFDHAVIRWPRALAIWTLAILIAAGLLLGIKAVLNRLESPGRDAFQADWVPMVQIQVVPIPAPLAPAPSAADVAVSTPGPPRTEADSPAVIPAPVPAPPPQQGN